MSVRRGRFTAVAVMVVAGTVALSCCGPSGGDRSTGAAQKAHAARASGGGAGLDGTWRMSGYGTLLTVHDGRMTMYQTTKAACLPGGTAEGADPGADGSTVFTGDDVWPMRPAGAPGRATLELAGSPGVRSLSRIGALPAACTRKAPDDPVHVFDVFWQTFAENYPFFRAKGVDWQAVRAKYRPRVTAHTTDKQLFALLTDMVKPLNDAHVYVASDTPQRYFAEPRPGTTVPSPDLDQRTTTYITDRDLKGKPLTRYAEGRIAYADLPGDRGYLRISGFAGYTGDENDRYATNRKALDTALDAVLTPARTSRLRGLVIDLRVNGGGYDSLGLDLAARLTDHPYRAYAKQVRDDPSDPTHFTHPQPVTVTPASGARYTGPVALLTGGSTVSAGETFVQAMMDRPHRTVRIGAATQGVFSDVLDRTLPNGWSFGLPDEEFLTTSGHTYDGTGIPPQTAEPVFTPEEFAQHRDSAFDAAIREMS